MKDLDRLEQAQTQEYRNRTKQLKSDQVNHVHVHVRYSLGKHLNVCYMYMYLEQGNQEIQRSNEERRERGKEKNRKGDG